MKIQLIDSRPGIVKAIVLKEWMRIGLSICLLGLPVILGYFSIQITDARNAEFAKNSSTPALGDEFDFVKQAPELQGIARAGTVPAAVSAVSAATQNKNWNPTESISHRHGLNPLKDLASFAKYGDVLKKGQIILLAAATAYATDPYQGKTLHKNGRIIDPASYIRSTIR